MVRSGRCAAPRDDWLKADFDDPDDPMHDWGIWVVTKDGGVVDVVGSLSEANMMADMYMAPAADRVERLAFIELVCGPFRNDL